MEFDIRGNLTETVEMTLSEFQETFVSKWHKENTTRYAIYDVFETYIADFKTLIAPNFTMWIDGSFVENKKHRPNDVDFVSFIDFKLYENHLKLIETRFEKYGAKKFYGKLLDAHVVPIYPDNHRRVFITKEEELAWLHLFSKTRPNKEGIRHLKGFIKIKFEENESE
jgi:hypothetical protein